MPVKPVSKRPSRHRVTKTSKWAARKFSRMSSLRKETAMPARIAVSEKLRLLPKKRADELRTVIPDLSESNARRLLSNVNTALLVNGNNFLTLLRSFSRLIEPHELRPEYFSVRNMGELIDLCNRRPELRYSRFFEVDPTKRVEATLNGVRYRGHAVSVSNGTVRIKLSYEAKATHAKEIVPFFKVFSLRDKDLVRLTAGRRTGRAMLKESFLSAIMQDK